jgi:hypothetical protein
VQRRSFIPVDLEVSASQLRYRSVDGRDSLDLNNIFVIPFDERSTEITVYSFRNTLCSPPTCKNTAHMYVRRFAPEIDNANGKYVVRPRTRTSE